MMDFGYWKAPGRRVAVPVRIVRDQGCTILVAALNKSDRESFPIKADDLFRPVNPVLISGGQK